MMKPNKLCRSVFVLLPCGLLATGLFLLLSQIATARPGTLFVQSGGSGLACTQAQPCALQTAISQAADGDVIYVSTGIYTNTGSAVVTITENIALFGGWNGASSGPVVRDPALYPTTLDGERQRRVVYIDGEITPTLSSFVIANGNATGLTANCFAPSVAERDGCGGGIFVYKASPVIANNIITNNVAAVTAIGGEYSTVGYGGGIYMHLSDGAIITGNTIVSNVGSLASYGKGGGVYTFQCGAGTEVQANYILSNTASMSNTASWGGGIHLADSSIIVQDNLIQGNVATAAGWSQGSGLYQWYGAPTILDNLVTGNTYGHAVYLGRSEAHFEGNRVLHNDASAGVYVIYGYGKGVRLLNNVIAGSGTYNFQAAGSSTDPLTITLVHNSLVGAGAEYGVYAGAYSTVVMTNNIIVSHTWGITNAFPASSIVQADHTLFWANANDGVRGTNPVYGNPAFVHPTVGDFHIGPNSAAIDTGIDAGVTVDIDGDIRPFNAMFDIGADEAVWRSLYLPLVIRNHLQ
jgi:hypothetical protein